MKQNNANFITTALICVALFPAATSYALPDAQLRDLSNRLFGSLPDTMPGSGQDTAAMASLGQQLFFEKGLSANETQSCNTCHDLTGSKSGTEPLSVSQGALGLTGTRNSLTVWNAGFQFSQFWDGRADSLEEQAKSPLLAHHEMALSSGLEAERILRERGYTPAFEAAFPNQDDPVTFDNAARALAAFQRTLITADRFDRWQKGDDKALSEMEKRGLERFVSTGCNACHNGPLMGGQLFMKMGLVNPYPNRIDKGRAHITGNAADDFLFKVPPLRNVAKTAPYFHDGAVYSLEQAVKDTAWHQLGVKLKPDAVEDITAFLKALDNEREVNFTVTDNEQTREE